MTVAELKARLSHYLRRVREGESFTILSRDIPVAVLGPYESGEADDLEAVPADPKAPALFAPVLGRPPHGLPDAVELLRADRDARESGPARSPEAGRPQPEESRE